MKQASVGLQSLDPSGSIHLASSVRHLWILGRKKSLKVRHFFAEM